MFFVRGCIQAVHARRVNWQLPEPATANMALDLGAVVAAYQRTIGRERAIRLGHWHRAGAMLCVVRAGCSQSLIAITIGHSDGSPLL